MYIKNTIFKIHAISAKEGGQERNYGLDSFMKQNP